MFIVQQKGEQIRAVEKDNKQEEVKKKKKGRRRSNRRCQCGGNLLHWGLFKSCISSIFPFSFCTGQISLLQPKRPVYSSTAGKKNFGRTSRYDMVSTSLIFSLLFDLHEKSLIFLVRRVFPLSRYRRTYLEGDRQ